MRMNGFESLMDPDDGRLERALTSDAWAIPAGLKVQDGRLRYLPKSSGKNGKVETGLLAEFAALADEPAANLPNAVLSYSGRFGVLGLCEQHGQPVGHPGSSNCAPAGWPSGPCSEAIDDWRLYARWFRAILRLAHQIYLGQEGDFEDWEVVAPGTAAWRSIYIPGAKKTFPFPPELRPSPRGLVPGKFGALIACVNTLLQRAPLQPRAVVGKDEIQIKLTPVSGFSQLSAILSTELLLAVARSRRIYTCSECARPYIPKRKPTRGERTFCRRCGIKASWRHASASFYERKKNAR